MASEILTLYERALRDLAELRRAFDGEGAAPRAGLATLVKVAERHAHWYEKRLKMRRPPWVLAKLAAQALAKS